MQSRQFFLLNTAIGSKASIVYIFLLFRKYPGRSYGLLHGKSTVNKEG